MPGLWSGHASRGTGTALPPRDTFWATATLPARLQRCTKPDAPPYSGPLMSCRRLLLSDAGKCSCIEGALSFGKRPVLNYCATKESSRRAAASSRAQRPGNRRGCRTVRAGGAQDGAFTHGARINDCGHFRVGWLRGAGSTVPVGAMAQSQAHQASGSWMLPEAKDEDLIYVSSLDYYPPSSTSSVYVFSYPGASLVGTLTGFQYVGGLCTDSSGSVWITDGTGEVSKGVIYEYAHGATTPKATLEDEARPMDCSWEPSSGNLAVSGEDRGGNIAVYPNAQRRSDVLQYHRFCRPLD